MTDIRYSKPLAGLRHTNYSSESFHGGGSCHIHSYQLYKLYETTKDERENDERTD